jgi:hypothetical protein
MSRLIRTPEDWFKEQQKKEAGDDAIPDNVPLAELAEQVVRGKVKLSAPQLRMLIELLPFHLPKLSAVGVGFMTNNTFAERLDRAIERTEATKRFTKLIELAAATVENNEPKEQ